MGGEVLAVVQRAVSGLPLLDMAPLGLTPAPRMSAAGCWPPTVRCCFTSPPTCCSFTSRTKSISTGCICTIFHCVFRHLWLKGRREPQLWSLACDIAVENVIDSLNRTSVKRPADLCAPECLPADHRRGKGSGSRPGVSVAHPADTGVLRQLEREFVTDDHRLWPKDAPDQLPADAHAAAPENVAEDRGERMQTELNLRDKEAGGRGRRPETAGKAANRSRRSYRDFLRRFCVLREESKAGPGRVRPELLHLRPFGVRKPAPSSSLWKAGRAKKDRGAGLLSSTPATPPPVNWCGHSLRRPPC